MNSLSFFLKYAKYRYMAYRIFVRMRIGKQRRDDHLEEKEISIYDFLPERPYSIGGIKGIPRRHTNDFVVLFTPREEVLKPHLQMKENETFVDIGANVGAYSLKIAKDYVGRGVYVIAIEAHPENYVALCRNIACNGLKNVNAINKAVSDHKGKVTMYEYLGYGSRTRFETYTIENSTIRTNLLAGTGSVQVPCDTLDDILAGRKVDLMKLDIEGAEVLALNGAKNTLKQLRKIIVEIHLDFEEVRLILERSNFKLEVIGEVKDWYKHEKQTFHGYIIGSK